MLQIGGQGSLTGDRGGGGFLGASAVCAVYDFLFKDGPGTCMKELFFELLDIDSRSGLMDAIVQGADRGRFLHKGFQHHRFQGRKPGRQGCPGHSGQHGKKKMLDLSIVQSEI